MNSSPTLAQLQFQRLENLLEHSSHYIIRHSHKMIVAKRVSAGLALMCAGMVALTIVCLSLGMTSLAAPFLGLGLLFLLLGVGFEVSSFKRKNSLEHRDSKIKTLHMIGYGKTLKTDEEKQLYSGLYHLYQQGQYSAYFWGKVKREHLAYCYHHQHSQP